MRELDVHVGELKKYLIVTIKTIDFPDRTRPGMMRGMDTSYYALEVLAKDRLDLEPRGPLERLDHRHRAQGPGGPARVVRLAHRALSGGRGHRRCGLPRARRSSRRLWIAVTVPAQAGLRAHGRGLRLRRLRSPRRRPRRTDSRRAGTPRAGTRAPLDRGAHHRAERRIAAAARAPRLPRGRRRARVGVQARPLARRRDHAATARPALTEPLRGARTRRGRARPEPVNRSQRRTTR